MLKVKMKIHLNGAQYETLYDLLRDKISKYSWECNGEKILFEHINKSDLKFNSFLLRGEIIPCNDGAIQCYFRFLKSTEIVTLIMNVCVVLMFCMILVLYQANWKVVLLLISALFLINGIDYIALLISSHMFVREIKKLL